MPCWLGGERGLPSDDRGVESVEDILDGSVYCATLLPPDSNVEGGADGEGVALNDDAVSTVLDGSDAAAGAAGVDAVS